MLQNLFTNGIVCQYEHRRSDIFWFNNFNRSATGVNSCGNGNGWEISFFISKFRVLLFLIKLYDFRKYFIRRWIFKYRYDCIACVTFSHKFTLFSLLFTSSILFFSSHCIRISVLNVVLIIHFRKVKIFLNTYKRIDSLILFFFSYFI